MAGTIGSIIGRAAVSGASKVAAGAATTAAEGAGVRAAATAEGGSVKTAATKALKSATESMKTTEDSISEKKQDKGYSALQRQILKQEGFSGRGFWFQDEKTKSTSGVTKEVINSVLQNSPFTKILEKLDLVIKKVSDVDNKVASFIDYVKEKEKQDQLERQESDLEKQKKAKDTSEAEKKEKIQKVTEGAASGLLAALPLLAKVGDFFANPMAFFMKQGLDKTATDTTKKILKGDDNQLKAALQGPQGEFNRKNLMATPEGRERLKKYDEKQKADAQKIADQNREVERLAKEKAAKGGVVGDISKQRQPTKEQIAAAATDTYIDPKTGNIVKREMVPEAKPAVPAEKPAVPAAKPAVPAAKPAVPAAKPAVPAAKPAPAIVKASKSASAPKVSPERTEAPAISLTDSKQLSMSEEGYTSLLRSEGFRDQAYKDTRGVWTIGVGETQWDGKPVSQSNPGRKITPEEALAKMKERVKKDFEPMVRRWLKIPITQSQFDSLVHLVYNSPKGAKKIIDKMNGGEQITQDDFMKATVIKENEKGLVTRREEEFAMFTGVKSDVGKKGTVLAAASPKSPPAAGALAMSGASSSTASTDTSKTMASNVPSGRSTSTSGTPPSNQFYLPDPNAPHKPEDHYAAYFNANNPPAYAALG